MGYVNGASPGAGSKPKEKASACPAIRVNVFVFTCLTSTATVYPVPGLRPPLDSKELQLHKLTLHTNTENGKPTESVHWHRFEIKMME
jgi:hypothetical protein